MNFPRFDHRYGMANHGNPNITPFEWLGMTGLSADDLLNCYETTTFKGIFKGI